MDPMPSILGFNGPKPITDDPDVAGMLDWDNLADNNDDKAVDRRVGLFLPVAGVGKLNRQYTALISLLLVASFG
jgi:hypothetical protein